jgi:hypothetical protein
VPVDAETLAEAAALIEAQSLARQQIAETTQLAVAVQVRAFTGWYDHSAITALAARLAKLTKAGQRQTASSTGAYATRVLRLLTGHRPTGTKPIDVSSGIRTIPLESAYGRLADNYRYLQATRGPGAPDALLDRHDAVPLPRLAEPEILDRIVLRSTLQVDDNLSLAFRDQWAADLADEPAVSGYRRVLHPELVAVGSSAPGPVCGLCLVSADRIYGKAELLPLHGRCRCSVSPIVGDADPGSVLNAQDLRDIYRQAGGTAAAKLKATKVFVAEHGELGPRLTFAQHATRTASQAAADDENAPAA